MLRAGVRGEFGFKGLAFLGQDILAGFQRADRRGFDFVVQEYFGERDFFHGVQLSLMVRASFADCSAASRMRTDSYPAQPSA